MSYKWPGIEIGSQHYPGIIDDLGKEVESLDVGKVDKTSIVNDLTTGGTTNVLSAEQGKTLKGLVDGNSTSINTLQTQTSFSLKNLASVETDSQTADGSQAYGLYYNTFRWDRPTAGTKHYVRVSILVPNECTQVSCYVYNGASADYVMWPQAPSVKNSFFAFSGVITQGATATTTSSCYIRHYYPDAATANGKVMQIQYLSVIDLTAAFGAGNEPTAAEMDAMLAQFPNSWFDGTKNVASNGYLLQNLLKLDNSNADTGVYANALVQTISGTGIRIDDVSPLEHKLRWTQYGQCIVSGTPTPDAPATITVKATGATVGDGTSTIATIAIADVQGNHAVLYGIPVSSEGNVTIDMNQYITDTADETGTIVRRIGVLKLTGTEEYSVFDTNGVYMVVPPSYKRIFPSRYLCSHCDGLDRTDVLYLTKAEFGQYANSVSDFKAFAAAQYAAGKPITIYYPLTTPITETFAIDPVVLSAKTPSITWTSDAYTKLAYNRDAVKVIDKLTRAIISLGGNV